MSDFRNGTGLWPIYAMSVCLPSLIRVSWYEFANACAPITGGQKVSNKLDITLFPGY